MASISQEYSLFEIDRELDMLLDEIEEQVEDRGEPSTELVDRFQQFCEANGEKADRIGRFLRMMEARVQYCRGETIRLQDRARSCDRKAAQTKNMVMYYLRSRDLKKIEGREFTLRIQKNSQDSVRITDGTRVPMRFRSVEARIDGQLWEMIVASCPASSKGSWSPRSVTPLPATRRSNMPCKTRSRFQEPTFIAANICVSRDAQIAERSRLKLSSCEIPILTASLPHQF